MESINHTEIKKKKDRIETVKRGSDVFTVFFTEDEKGKEYVKDIILERTEKGKKIKMSFAKYLPEGWKFNTDPFFGGGNVENKEVEFPLSGLSLDCACTILLHELGHANCHEKRLKNGTWPSNEDIYSDDTGKAEARSERDAWAFALQEILKLKSSGIIADDIWKDLELLKNEIYTSLSSYEKNPKNKQVAQEKPFTKHKKFDKTDSEQKIRKIQDKEFLQLLRQINFESKKRLRRITSSIK
ncbi:hypothetical protein A2738_01215 [Candidatus Nomurabacteria bacterium RIFCSPHIGHO2_01_FULL_42_15]|uniref:Uncharacterized protein n=1 Tax=Candidatus Nomurabacteria bacterium RIFCSPHIGHO2_01_FULL_42_15 TaxID=1801742 RepID=A0A1F6VFY7_9BACT|nr:MAG: hypothetical protein A2738_01215 [Candidatus Nomurabacteria bacterium RIFCSPHIGHO2_01_FULL_42_15]OGI93089.1 MAG: hypothetical protein A3A99_00955 [Candidatus Nomurabacteria bacterium RIFCSPLOWO2_01_FULL_41_18]